MDRDEIQNNIITQEYFITKEKLDDFLDLIFSQYQKVKMENLKLKEKIKTLEKTYLREDSGSCAFNE